MNHLVISFMTKDRPGLVETLSKVVKQHQGNWQNSSLHHLSGFFTGVLEIAVEQAQSAALTRDLKALPGFTINIEQATPEKANNAANIVLELTANDREGIVEEISAVIHHRGGNMLKLVSVQDNAPHTGQALFKAKITLSVDNKQTDSLISALEDLADDLMVDISR
ncbi:MAG: glycine cleavage system regulatory protein [Colwellia sp.]|jgi:glycine cleavage system regulatory protein|uniref:glycine cleavage system protein R n=1 Tax=Colwellia sp. Bg11-12 TaxID=2759817 RepID=UPI0015F544F4|nr:ACT domain-containing protein [Colwellia sp. Bg11-12]MBA6263028.1 amino acid-binding protein [Colwellia sp. Bg11-12]